jgi:NAD(P)-dependent dehydrogenase (short-subunit alcohol dehydrogenase family)
MNLGIEGRTALVTAASRGLGRSIAKCLAQEGVKIAAVARTESDIASLMSEIGGPARGHRGFVIDLVRDDGPASLLAQMRDSGCPPVNIVVHNLGGDLAIKDPFCSVEDWRRVWRINVEVAVELNLALVPPMQQKKWGRIVFISSISSMENHGAVPYCAAKAAVNAYARSMGRVLAKDGIIMTSVLPGAVLTEGGYWDKSSRERPEHVRKYLSERMAIGRFGRPDEIGEVVAFLCSEYASFCVGSIVPVDGGQGRGFFGQ